MKITAPLRLLTVGALVCLAQPRADAAVISFSSADYSVREDNGSATLTVTIDRSSDPDPGQRYTVKYKTLSGSASEGSDYEHVESELVFEPGVNSESISVPIIDDAAIENTESFSAILYDPNPRCEPRPSDPPCYYPTPTFRTSTATVRIFDNDRANTVQFSPSSYNASEAGPGGQDGQVTLTVTAARFGDPTTTIEVDYSTGDGSAVDGTDYRATSGTVTFGPGETQKQITVSLINDLFIEETKTFSVELEPPRGAIFGTGARRASVNVQDDDGGTSTIEFSSDNYSVGEASGPAVITAIRSGGIGFAVSASYNTADETATSGQDYEANSRQVTFGPGEYSKPISIAIFQDSALEPSETFTITLSDPSVNAAIGARSKATVSILDDEGPPVITSPRSASGQRDQAFSYRITATNSPSSYNATGLPSGLSIDTATGLISGTPNDFGTFAVEISATNDRGTGTATLTIAIASGETTVVQFRNEFQTVTHPQNSVTLIVDLLRAGGDSEPFSVDFHTSDGSAKAGEDYGPQSGTLFFDSGQKQQTITIAINPPDTPRTDRNFFVDLTNPSRGAVARARATVVISHPDSSTKLLNISTRAPVRGGEGVMIAGFILEGSAPKRTVLRGIGPSLTSRGVAGAIQDPTLSLMDSNGSQIAFNDDHGQNSAEDLNALAESGFVPEDARESAIIGTLAPGIYTAILRGKSTGAGLVEVYDISGTAPSRLANLATRSRVNEGDNGAMIAGFIISSPPNQPGTTQRVVIRAIGPSLGDAGVDDVLENPTLDIYSGSQLILSNDDWKSDQRQELEAAGLAPTNNREAAIITDLEPGSYSAVIRGKNNTTGVALAEVYQLTR